MKNYRLFYERRTAFYINLEAESLEEAFEKVESGDYDENLEECDGSSDWYLDRNDYEEL